MELEGVMKTVEELATDYAARITSHDSEREYNFCRLDFLMGYKSAETRIKELEERLKNSFTIEQLKEAFGVAINVVDASGWVTGKHILEALTKISEKGNKG